MQVAAVSLLTDWGTFYILIGTAAATLTGLMFVVASLLANARRAHAASEAFASFNTPNVWHFSLALLVAALLVVPWQALWQASVLLGLTGLGGVSYALLVLRRMRRQRDYQPVFEDWLFHAILPLVSYTAFVLAAILLPVQPASALFVIAAAAVLLLFIGIHNAWDNVTFITLELSGPENTPQDL